MDTEINTSPVAAEPIAGVSANQTARDAYLAEFREHSALLSADLRAFETVAPGTDEQQLTHRLHRAARAIRGAGFFGWTKISDLAQKIENAIVPAYDTDMSVKRFRIRVLTVAAERLRGLLETPEKSNQIEIPDALKAISRINQLDAYRSKVLNRVPDPETVPSNEELRFLVAEDEAGTRHLLKTFLSRYGRCDVALDGEEAVEKFCTALKRNRGYHLICMDVQMPKMSGREAVQRVRVAEASRGISPLARTKIIMTTAINEMDEVIRCFQEFSDHYMVKPIGLANLLRQLKTYRLIAE
jgi:two-component system chemotaxis response regulator CheY